MLPPEPIFWGNSALDSIEKCTYLFQHVSLLFLSFLLDLDLNLFPEFFHFPKFANLLQSLFCHLFFHQFLSNLQTKHKSNINPVSAQPSFRPNPRQVNRRSNSSSYQNGGQPNLNNMSRMPNQLNQNYMPSNQYADNNSNNYSFRPSENF